MNDLLKKLKNDIQIDEFALEKECVKQPQLYAEIGALYVDAKAAARNAKKVVDFLQDDLDEKIRLNAEKFSLTGRITESAISSTIRRDLNYRRLFENYLELQRISDHFQILLDSAAQRKSAIKDLVSLYIYNYYSDTTMGKEIHATDKIIEQQIIQARKDKIDRQEHEDVEKDS